MAGRQPEETPAGSPRAVSHQRIVSQQSSRSPSLRTSGKNACSTILDRQSFSRSSSFLSVALPTTDPSDGSNFVRNVRRFDEFWLSSITHARLRARLLSLEMPYFIRLRSPTTLCRAGIDWRRVLWCPVVRASPRHGIHVTHTVIGEL